MEHDYGIRPAYPPPYMHHAPAPSEVLSAFLHQGTDNLL